MTGALTAIPLCVTSSSDQLERLDPFRVREGEVGLGEVERERAWKAGGEEGEPEEEPQERESRSDSAGEGGAMGIGMGEAWSSSWSFVVVIAGRSSSCVVREKEEERAWDVTSSWRSGGCRGELVGVGL